MCPIAILGLTCDLQLGLHGSSITVWQSSGGQLQSITSDVNIGNSAIR